MVGTPVFKRCVPVWLWCDEHKCCDIFRGQTYVHLDGKTYCMAAYDEVRQKEEESGE